MEYSITKAISISFVGGLFGRALRYGLNVVIARELGAEVLGAFAFGLVLMKAASLFAQVGLGNATQKYIPIYSQSGNSNKVSGVVILSLILPFILGCICSVLVYLLTVYRPTLFPAEFLPQIRLLLVGIPLFSTMMVGIAATKGFKQTEYSVYIRDIGQSGSAFFIIGFLVLLFPDLYSVVTGFLISLIIAIVIVMMSLSRQGAFLGVRDIDIPAKKVLTFSIPLLFVSAVQYLMSWTDVLLLGVLRPAADVGYYHVAFQTSVLLLIVLQSMNSIFPPIASELYQKGDIDRLDQTYTAVTKWVSYLTVVGCIFLVVFARGIIQIFGSDFIIAEQALVILSVGQVISAVVGPTGYLLTMVGYERLELLNTIVMSLVNLVLNLVLIPEYGILGAAAATSFSFAAMNIAQLVEIRYILGINPYSFSYWRGVVAVVVATPVILLGTQIPTTTLLQILITGVLSLGTFVAVLWALGFDAQDRILLESIQNS